MSFAIVYRKQTNAFIQADETTLFKMSHKIKIPFKTRKKIGFFKLSPFIVFCILTFSR